MACRLVPNDCPILGRLLSLVAIVENGAARYTLPILLCSDSFREHACFWLSDMRWGFGRTVEVLAGRSAGCAEAGKVFVFLLLAGVLMGEGETHMEWCGASWIDMMPL